MSQRGRKFVEPRTPLASFLRTSRRDAGFAPEYLAERLGVHRATVLSWERGSSVPTVESLLAFCRVCGVTLSALKCG